MEVKIEKLVFGGQGMGRVNGKVVFVWGALPGETVTVRLIRNKKDYAEGVIESIIQAAPERQAPLETHYLSCSPWQVLSPTAEAYWKVQLGRDAYYAWHDHYNLDQLDMVNDLDTQIRYRNKIEYSFWQNGDKLNLAFFERGSHRRYAISPCVLAHPAINDTAEIVLDWLRQSGMTGYNLKSLIILANERGQTTASLFLKDNVPVQRQLALSGPLAGWQLYYSNPKSPAAVPTELLYQAGQVDCISRVLQTSLKHSLLGFFQVNVPIFERAVQAIGNWLDPSSPMIDYYSGVGSISLPLAKHYAQALLVESNQAAADLATQNITALGLANKCQAVCTLTEAMLAMMTPEHIVVVDPPRVGLHDSVIERFVQVRPRRIIYLSCNLSTQSRDVAKLLDYYAICDVKLFNFFPRTPHLEGLCVLERNTS